MARLTIDIPDNLAEALETEPPECVQGHAVRALEDFAARTQELRRHDEDLVARIEAALPGANHPAVFKPAQAAVHLQVSQRQIERMMSAGELRVVHIGAAARIPYDDVMALVTPPPPPGIPKRVSQRRRPPA